MAVLVGLAGFGGAGKTTAAEYLAACGFGERLYLGEAVLREVRARGLEITPENERRVRVELRKEHGNDVLAIREAERAMTLIGNGSCVFVDAIFAFEEFASLRAKCKASRSLLLAIEASFAVRRDRVGSRPRRPIEAEELRARDQTEISTLLTDSVMKRADYRIANEGTLDDFQQALRRFWGNQL